MSMFETIMVIFAAINSALAFITLIIQLIDKLFSKKRK